MSHFSVLVFGPDHEKQLAPYHEFECTGEDNEFVVDVDETEQARETYEEHTDRRLVEQATGTSFDAYDNRFYRDPTPEELAEIGPISGTGGNGKGMSWSTRDWEDGRGHRPKIRHVPDGFVEQEVLTSTLQTFLEFIQDYYGRKILRPGEPRTDDHKYGFVEVDNKNEVVRVVDRTNPEKKWDWFQVGGRWSQSLRLKPGSEGAEGERSWWNAGAPDKPGYCDQAMLGDIDFDAERDALGDEGGKNFDRWIAAISDHPQPRSWSEIRGENANDIEKAREIYNAQPAIIASRREEYRSFIPMLQCPVEYYGFDRAAYVERKRLGAMVPYAFVHEGKWYGKGEMGWFGCSHDEKGSEDDWSRFFHDFLSKLPPDTLVTMVDCHI